MSIYFEGDLDVCGGYDNISIEVTSKDGFAYLNEQQTKTLIYRLNNFFDKNKTKEINKDGR